MEKYAIIVAGGSGLRAGGTLPKQFQDVAGKPMFLWSIESFRRADSETRIILVVHPDFIDLCSSILSEWKVTDVTIVHGGHSRWASVKNGLQLVPDSADALVAVHDAARPLVSSALIRRGWDEVFDCGAVIPVVAVTDSLREKNPADGSTSPVERSRYLAVQTPQVFFSSILHKAYRQPESPSFTDDASVVENMGLPVSVMLGEPENIKVTHPLDFYIATAVINEKTL